VLLEPHEAPAKGRVTKAARREKVWKVVRFIGELLGKDPDGWSKSRSANLVRVRSRRPCSTPLRPAQGERRQAERNDGSVLLVAFGRNGRLSEVQWRPVSKSVTFFRCGPMFGSQSVASDSLYPPQTAFVGRLLFACWRRGVSRTRWADSSSRPTRPSPPPGPALGCAAFPGWGGARFIPRIAETII
jgi:hypothetical protein